MDKFRYLSRFFSDFFKNPLLTWKKGLIVLFIFSLIFYFFSNLFVPQKDFSFLATDEGLSFIGENIEDLFFRPKPVQMSNLGFFDFGLIEGNTLGPALFSVTISPQALAVLIGSDFEIDHLRKEVKEYIIQQGDTLSSIANRFDVSLNTILWANNLTKKSLIKPGQKLIILPVSGIIHNVRKGDTLGGIAQKYKADVDEIIVFNEISREGDIYIGDILIVPNGKMPLALTRPDRNQIPLAATYFILPATGRISQGLHLYNAIDIANHCGSPIYAVAQGKVLRVKFTLSRSPSVYGGAGNHLTILHPNGVVSFYGHLLHSYVKTGDEVSQGQIIARMGGEPGTPGAGRTTGCHLHFCVRNARNPFVNLPLGSFVK